MATKKSSKAKGGWTSETLAEYEQSKALVWRAQRSVSPEGKTFVGVRKYIIKADGTDMHTQAGFNIPEDEGSPELLKALASLLANTKWSKGKAKAAAEEDSAPRKKYVIKKGPKYLITARLDEDGKIKVKTTTEVSEAKVFVTQAAARHYGAVTVLSDDLGWGVVPAPKEE